MYPQFRLYIRSLPLHRSQEILVDDSEEFRIAIHVKPNFELKQRILMYGEEVDVLEPINLLETI